MINDDALILRGALSKAGPLSRSFLEAEELAGFKAAASVRYGNGWN